MDRLFNVGAYVRLSMEAASYDSESVENQKEMLSKFIIMMPGWVEEKFYVDDGYSGASFQRPAFQEMMADVRAGRVNLVLVKDLSRFGRNYLEAGHYLEEELPALGCRFVSLTEGIDTETGENDIMPFLNAMNDYYLKNHSDRIRSVMAAKARDGQKISGNAPYGYRRDSEVTTRLLIDDYAAGVVRRIFQMRAQGFGYGLIVKTLNGDDILPPLLYYLRENGRDYSFLQRRVWTAATVRSMLRNELYIGNAVQLIKQIVSHRDKREVYRPQDEHVRVDGAFPAIIDRGTWDAVQAVNDQASLRNKKRCAPQKQLFTGIVVCADCGKNLVSIRNERQTKTRGIATYVSYHCQTYQVTSGFGCTIHTVSEPALIRIVSGQIMELAERIRLDEDSMLASLTGRIADGASASKAERGKERRLLKQRLHRLEVLTAKIYEDRVVGTLDEDSFSRILLENEAERREKEKRLALLEESEQESAAMIADAKQWMALMRKNAGIKELTRDLLESVVERIEISEVKGADGSRRQDVRIVYRFVGSIQVFASK
jgi:DNA invertase Pin-like site-specific DNA recombinase